MKGQQINGDSLTDSGKYYVMNGGTAPSGYFNEYNSEADTISVSEGGNSCGYVQYNSVPFWSSGHCYTLKDLSSDLDKHYLYHYLKNKENDIMQLRIGTGLPNIQKKDLERFEVIVPEVCIQMNMSHILNLLDGKISNEYNFLHCLLVEKKYLQNQMFI